MSRTRLVWHRKGDLRLHDNELYKNHDDGDDTKIVSLYVINPCDYESRCVTGSQTSDKLWTVNEGPHASCALIRALTDLRSNLRALGGELWIRRGDPLQIVPAVAKQVQAHEVWWSEVPGSYERQQSEELKERFEVLGQENQNHTGVQVKVHTVASYTLYHPDDLPRGEDTWTRLARPNQQVSAKKKKARKKCNKMDANAHDANQSNDATLPEQKPLSIEVDCSPSRWVGLPRIMGDFRRAARTAASVRPCYQLLSKELFYSIVDNEKISLLAGDLPTMEELTQSFRGMSLFGLPEGIIDDIIEAAATTQSNIVTSGGETLARQQWLEFLTKHAATADRSLADTSNHQSAHISTALALGLLSPRHIHWSVVQHQQQEQPKADSSGCHQWLISHMEMRDYFLYSAFAADEKLYHLYGPTTPVHKSKQKRVAQAKSNQDNQSPNDAIVWRPLQDPSSKQLFTQWATGQTGLPLVDAGMNELLRTGYCSNRVRQNMASVLTKDLHIDWRIGAEWFQFCLQDHCVAANWGNWRYFGGVGGDPKNRHFRTISQALRYDPEGGYVSKWLFDHQKKNNHDNNSQHNTVLVEIGKGSSEALSQLAGQDAREALFRPWDFVGREDWPTIVDAVTQYTWHDRQRLEQTGSLFEG